MKLLSTLFILCLFSLQANADIYQKPKHHVIRASFQSNFTPSTPKQNYQVYLPANLEKDKTYPVMYFFHGYTQSPYAFTAMGVNALKKMTAKTQQPFIMVAINGDNGLGGSFWVNQTNGEKWRDMVVKEFVPLIDSLYPTKPQAENRMLVGFSMGGFAALNIGFNHPDVFSHVFSLSPGALTTDGLKEAMPLWDEQFKQAYALAFDANNKIPQMTNTPEDLAIQQQWQMGFGRFDGLIAEYVKNRHNKNPLLSININWGSMDYYSWIPKGNQHVVDLLNQHEIKVNSQIFSRGHEFSRKNFEQEVLPVVNEVWIFE